MAPRVLHHPDVHGTRVVIPLSGGLLTRGALSAVDHVMRAVAADRAEDPLLALQDHVPVRSSRLRHRRHVGGCAAHDPATLTP
jgi:small nuclear ribonucleoprotein (snRNP)-like protein